ncbi:MAG: hypothetical protein QM535_21920, partial [Limnohabitans sp.]|nr:hypothetical protein [Limnohabitans sp.]
MTSKHQPIANPGCGSGLTSNIQLLFLTSTLYFQSAAVVGGWNTNFQPAQSPSVGSNSPYSEKPSCKSGLTIVP